jgi:hypothetical protein
MRHILGLDLGQAQDFTALVGLEQSQRRERPATGGRIGRWCRDYGCRLLKRWPLGTPYTLVVRDVAQAAGRLPARPVLVVDGTGCGRGPVDMFRGASLPVLQLVAVNITGGFKAGFEGGYHTVPKKDLVGAVQSALQGRRLRIARRLREAATLTRELTAFRVKVNVATGNESFEAWRERDHDDMVLALALALWWGERGTEARVVTF